MATGGTIARDDAEFSEWKLHFLSRGATVSLSADISLVNRPSLATSTLP